MDFTHVANPVQVVAERILSVVADPKTKGFMVHLSNGDDFHVDGAMCARHVPVVGDYLVTQEDGYVYVNPREVFERKYSPVEAAVPAKSEAQVRFERDIRFQLFHIERSYGGQRLLERVEENFRYVMDGTIPPPKKPEDKPLKF